MIAKKGRVFALFKNRPIRILSIQYWAKLILNAHAVIGDH